MLSLVTMLRPARGLFRMTPTIYPLRAKSRNIDIKQIRQYLLLILLRQNISANINKELHSLTHKLRKIRP